MLTWIRLWPVFVIPVFLLNAIGFLPTYFYEGRHWGGGPIRQWMLNTFLIPILNYDQGKQIIQWFNEASVLQESLMYSLIILNINVFLIPVLYGAGNVLMKGLNRIPVRGLELKRQAVR